MTIPQFVKRQFILAGVGGVLGTIQHKVTPGKRSGFRQLGGRNIAARVARLGGEVGWGGVWWDEQLHGCSQKKGCVDIEGGMQISVSQSRKEAKREGSKMTSVKVVR